MVHFHNDRPNHPIYYTSELLKDFPHGFFTRYGGVSPGVTSSLDCRIPSRTARTPNPFAYDNLQIALNALGLGGHHLSITELEHKDNIHHPESASSPSNLVQADGQIAKSSQMALAVTSADCTPILLGDPTTGFFGAVHAGWRGVAKQILTKAITMLIAKGAEPNNIRACIGPCIAQEHLKLNASILDIFLSINSESKQFFHDYHLDMRQLLVWELEQANIQYIDHCNYNTYSNNDFFSARRARHLSENLFGAQPSIIGGPLCPK